MRSFPLLVAALLLATPAAAQVGEAPQELNAVDACIAVSRGTFLSEAMQPIGFTDADNDGAWDWREGTTLIRISRQSERLKDGTTLEQCIVARWPKLESTAQIGSGMADRARRQEMAELPGRTTPAGGVMRAWATEGQASSRLLTQVEYAPDKSRPDGGLVLTVAWIVK